MENVYVKQIILPAAKLVPEELQKIGKLPAIIYPVNDGIVFDFLLAQYEYISSTIDILCYEKADKVHRRLAKYKSSKINVIDLPALDDLGHTIYYALSDKSKEVIINFADTIVSDNIFDIQGDCFFYSEDYYSETWTFFEEQDGVITDIRDKISQEGSSSIKAKLFVGVFQLQDGAFFKKCLEVSFDEENRKMNSFYRALQLYSEKYGLKPIKTDKWFDIGHVDKYYSTQLEVKAREFNHITIDKSRGKLRKTSDDKEKFIGEILWYIRLPESIEYSRPRIFSYSVNYDSPYVEMEYYAYHTVHELFLYGDLTYQQWRDTFERIRFICNDYRQYKVTGSSIRPSLEEMYLNKTISRMDKLRKDENFSRFFGNPITVNGVRYKSINKVTEVLKTIIPMLYDVDEFNIIHGDLCFANIMIDNNFSFIKVIDPRGKFGEYDIYGDFRYELAKLFHSVDGKYDFIIKDLFDIKVDTENISIEYTVNERKRDFDIYQLFTEVFSSEIGADKNKIELIEALLFLSMIPLHGESKNHQFAMLATGLEILNRVSDITEN